MTMVLLLHRAIIKIILLSIALFVVTDYIKPSWLLQRVVHSYKNDDDSGDDHRLLLGTANTSTLEHSSLRSSRHHQQEDVCGNNLFHNSHLEVDKLKHWAAFGENTFISLVEPGVGHGNEHAIQVADRRDWFSGTYQALQNISCLAVGDLMEITFQVKLPNPISITCDPKIPNNKAGCPFVNLGTNYQDGTYHLESIYDNHMAWNIDAGEWNTFRGTHKMTPQNIAFSSITASPVNDMYVSFLGGQGDMMIKNLKIRSRHTALVEKVKTRSTSDHLIVYNAIGRKPNLALVEHSRRNVFKKDKWDCMAFMFVDETRIPDDDEHLLALRDELHCSIIRTPGVMWGTFLQYISPTFVSNYDHIALVLDDMFIPDRGTGSIDPSELVEKMEKYNVDVLQPSIVGDSYSLRDIAANRRFSNCLVEVDMIETYIQIFTRDAWECYYKMLHHTGGKGWCYDVCFRSQCPNFKMGIDFSMSAFHLDWKQKDSIPPENILGTNLTEWEQEPRFLKRADSYYSMQGEAAICEKLHCPSTTVTEWTAMREISCPMLPTLAVNV